MIRDLGCGSGSLGRWLAPQLPGPQHWVLHDRDAALLARAEAGLPATAADGTPVTARVEQGDLTDLDAAQLAGTSLVAASALLDLLTAEEVDALADACTAAGCPALLTLSVTGSVGFFPAEPLDSVFGAAFDAHQRRTVVSDSGSRRLLGPDAGATAEHAFAQARRRDRGPVQPVAAGTGLGRTRVGRADRGVAARLDRRRLRAATRPRGLRGRLPAPPDLRLRGGRTAGRRRPPRRARPTWSDRFRSPLQGGTT